MQSVPLSVGQHLGRFILVRLAAVGGTGEVYEAQDEHGRKVALKLLLPCLEDDDESRHRFREELALWSRLSHPGIVRLIESGEHEGRPFLVSEWVDGRTLAEVLACGNRDSGPQDSRGRYEAPAKALAWIGEIAEALAAAHGLGIVHRDLKPSNIMIDSQGRARLIDFGLAKPTLPELGGERSFETMHGRVLGTPAYMSPEQARGDAMTLASDVFSFGALAHELLSGQPVFERESLAETLRAVLTFSPKRLRQISPPRGRELSRLIASCLEKDPAQRPPDARHLVVRLHELSRAPGRRLHRTALTLSLLVLMLLIAGAASALSRRSKRTDATPAHTTVGLKELDIDGSLPVITRDGQGVVFRSDDTREIWFAPIGDGNPQLIHAGSGVIFDLALSADNSQVFFVSAGEKDRQWISVVPLHGGAARRIVEGSAVAITPDGKTLVYASVPGPGILLLGSCAFDGAGQHTVRRICEASTLRDLAITRDGTEAILALSDGLRSSELVAIDLSDGSLRQVAEVYGAARPGIALTPEGKDVLWSLAIDGAIGNVIGRTPLDQGGFEPLYPGSGNLTCLSLSADGRKLVFAAEDRHLEIVEARVDPQGKEPASSFRVLARLVGTQPRVSPRGDRIAFQSERSDIWLFDRTSGDLAPLLATGESTFNPAWSADGELIAYASVRDDQSDLWLAGAAGDDPRQITDDDANDFQPVWHPNGTQILFISDRDGAEDLYSVELASGTIRRIGFDGAINPAISPDGSLLAYVVPCRGARVELRLQRLGTGLSLGEIVWALPLERNRWAGAKPRFSPDGRLVAFDQARETRGADIYAYPTHPPFPATPQRLTHFSQDVSTIAWFDWSPEGILVISAARGENRFVLLKGMDVLLGR